MTFVVICKRILSETRQDVMLLTMCKLLGKGLNKLVFCEISIKILVGRYQTYTKDFKYVTFGLKVTSS